MAGGGEYPSAFILCNELHLYQTHNELDCIYAATFSRNTKTRPFMFLSITVITAITYEQDRDNKTWTLYAISPLLAPPLLSPRPHLQQQLHQLPQRHSPLATHAGLLRCVCPEKHHLQCCTIPPHGYLAKW